MYCKLGYLNYKGRIYAWESDRISYITFSKIPISSNGEINGNLELPDFLLVLEIIGKHIIPSELNYHNVPILSLFQAEVIRGNFLVRKELTLLIDPNTYCKVSYWHGFDNCFRPTTFGHISLICTEPNFCPSLISKLQNVFEEF